MFETMRNNRIISVLTNEVWALEPGKLMQVAEFAQALVEGHSTNGEMFARVAGDSDGASRPYFLTDSGVAVIGVDGVIGRRLNLFQSISGGCSTELLGKYIRAAAHDPAARAIVMDINSPGGGVFGLTDLVEIIRLARESKPVVAFTPETMCSAAYWIGSAADEMVCTVDAEVGSVGVACMHFDRSAKDEKDGVKRTILYAGEYKRISSDEKPLTEEGTAYLQQKVDQYYALFVEAVAANRGMSVEDVLANLADGSTRIGAEAQAAGFVHHVGNMEFAIGRALKLADTSTYTLEATMPVPTDGTGTAAGGGSGSFDLSALTVEQLTQANPDLAAAMMATGVNAERQRVVELLETGTDPKLTLEAVKDGIDSKSFFKQALDSERKGKAAALETFEKNMSQSAGGDGRETTDAGGDDFDALVSAHMGSAKCSKGNAILAMGRKHPAAHSAWVDSQN
ncbi:MAG: S49 family peptidase [Pseudodesulfovibrio sp.]|nr:S49 family peptidase [Pseudodesulfovibrio sp.]